MLGVATGVPHGCRSCFAAGPNQMKIAIVRFVALVILLSACRICGCSRKPDPTPSMAHGSMVPLPQPLASKSPNATILDEANRKRTWFHAKKVRPIRARKLVKDETVQTLEGPVEAKAGDFLCRGEAGEPWPQSAKSLHERYVETGEIDAEGWRQFTPRPDAEGVIAAKIDHPFTVMATWGQLSGKAGDYLIKKFADRDAPDPVDVWIVDAKLFQATYAPVDGSARPVSADKP